MAAGRQDQKKGGGPATKRQTEQRTTPSSNVPPKSPVIGLFQQSPLESLATTPTHVQPPQDKKQDTFQDDQRKQEANNGAIAKAVHQQTQAPAPPAKEATKPISPPNESPPPAPIPDNTNTGGKPPGKLPQVPPRVQSQGSVNRGPPPAIPPRPQAILQRAGTVQVQSKPPMTRTTITRQQSATSMAPQCTPQPPPKFVIPQRQNSRASLTRQQSNTSMGSPQSPKKH